MNWHPWGNVFTMGLQLWAISLGFQIVLIVVKGMFR